MAEGYLELSVAAVCDLIEAYTGNTTAGDALVHAKIGYKRFLMGLDPRTQKVHTFSFLQPIATLSITADATGTATGVYDSDEDETTITATASIFYEWMIGETITVADVGDLTITSYTSATVVVADAGEDFDSKAITVAHPGVYNLPVDFGGLLGPVSYIRNTNYENPGIRTVDPEFVIDQWRRDSSQDSTIYVAIAPGSLVTTAQAAGRNVMIVAPRSMYDRTLTYRYRRLPLDVTDSTSAYFLGGPIHNETILECALAAAELSMNKGSGQHEERAAKMLAASIDIDRAGFSRGQAEQIVR